MMIGLVIVTHGALGKEFYKALEHVLGPQRQIATVSIYDADGDDQLRDEIRAAVRSVDSGSGVVMLTDMFGGTPSNLAISAMNGRPVEVITGINLPMLISIAKSRQKNSLTDAVTDARTAGRKYIRLASDILCRYPRQTQQ